MILSFSNPLIVAAWFVWWQGNLGLGQMKCPHKLGTYLEISLIGRGPI